MRTTVTIGNHDGQTGPVIPVEKMEFLFESFFTSGKKKGTGLGLAIAKKVVEAHGGTITVTSTSTKGTVFTFTLPRLPIPTFIQPEGLLTSSQAAVHFLQGVSDRVSSERLQAIKDVCQSINRKLNLVIVDDEPIFRNSLRNLIASHETLHELIEIYETHNAEEALTLLNKTLNKIDFAVIDIDMGKGMNGLELAQIIHKDYPHVRFMIHSNRTLREYQEAAKEMGALGFIPKPMTLNQMIHFLSDGVNAIPTLHSKESQENVLDRTQELKPKIICYIADD